MAGPPPERTPRSRRILKVAIVAAGLGFVGLGALALFVGGRLTAPCPAVIGDAPPDLQAKELELRDADGRAVRGWGVRAEPSKGVVVLLHGIRGSRRSMIARARFLRAGGYSSVLIDLHAHGESDGDAITLGVREGASVKAAVEHARARHPDEPLLALGVSLGGAAALLAPPLGLDGLILESVYPDIESAVKNRVRVHLGALAGLPTWLLLRQVSPRLDVELDALRPIDRIGSLTCALFILGGELDPHTPPRETRELFDAATSDKQLWIVDGAGHVDLYGSAQQEYEDRVLTFLDHCTSGPGGR